ncbi:MAG: monovalent cation/H(+) antiporter subunit G [bacterium]
MQIAAGVVLLFGGVFGFFAALGMLRLPDTIIRMHAATKAGTLGCGCALLAVALHYPDAATTLRAVAAIFFVSLTAPVAAHLIGRAAYRSGIHLWHGTWVDELEHSHDGEQRRRSTIKRKHSPR